MFVWGQYIQPRKTADLWKTASSGGDKGVETGDVMCYNNTQYKRHHYMVNAMKGRVGGRMNKEQQREKAPTAESAFLGKPLKFAPERCPESLMTNGEASRRQRPDSLRQLNECLSGKRAGTWVVPRNRYPSQEGRFFYS